MSLDSLYGDALRQIERVKAERDTYQQLFEEYDGYMRLAISALKSYQFHNDSPALAEEVVQACEHIVKRNGLVEYES